MVLAPMNTVALTWAPKFQIMRSFSNQGKSLGTLETFGSRPYPHPMVQEIVLARDKCQGTRASLLAGGIARFRGYSPP